MRKNKSPYYIIRLFTTSPLVYQVPDDDSYIVRAGSLDLVLEEVCKFARKKEIIKKEENINLTPRSEGLWSVEIVDGTLFVGKVERVGETLVDLDKKEPKEDGK